MLSNETAARQPIERRASLKDVAYLQIKGLLVSGQLAHDQLYSAQHFAEMLGVSRTPAREALLQLASEGYLVCHDVRGFQVKDFTAKEIQDIFETRQVIESHVIKQLLDRCAAEDVICMEQSVAAMNGCGAQGDAVGFLEADKEFHMLPVRRSGNLHLLSIMETIRNHISIFGLKVLAHPGRFAEVGREHGAIVAALRQGDKRKAMQAITHHLATTERYLLGGPRGPR